MRRRDESWRHVEGVVRRAGTSFLWTFRIIPRERRRAMFAVYAFCREVDDIADGEADPEAKRQALGAWRREISDLYAGRPVSLRARALAEVIPRFDLPEEEFQAIIDGMETDIGSEVGMDRLDDLLAYCRRVAGAVGMLVIHIFSIEAAPGSRLAWVMGNAFQLTNILRDVDEDAGNGRCYVPRDVLARHGVGAAAPGEVLRDPGFPAACTELAVLARGYFLEAERCLEDIGHRRLRPLVAMLKVYSDILALLERRGWEERRVAVRQTRGRRLWLVLRYGTF